MSESRQCSHCNESITITEQTLEDLMSRLECPNCGEFSLKRQSDERLKKATDLFLYVDGKKKDGVTMDVSEGGAKVFHLGSVLPTDKEVRIDIKEMSIQDQKAIVVWSRKSANTYSHTGLKFID